MYRNLEAEIARSGVTRKEIANVIGCTVGTVCQKLNGKSAFTLSEAKTIKDFLAVDISIEDLFASNDT